ncbi:MAG: ABC transporter substrate-binding protein [Sphingomonadales bacterium]|nr:ABC transporter substrate-binding protein [Sphingomonadales bacterium]
MVSWRGLAVLGLAALTLAGGQRPSAVPGAVAPPAPPAPARVVSINLCTDQLAMLLAAPGQLVAVSDIATDPLSSAMAEQAAAYPATHGLAEEVYLLHPDLVLAGTYSPRATVEMLRGLGIPVVEFAPASGIEDIRAGLTQMGAALGREAEAAAMIADFDARLAALRAPAGAPRPRAAIYSANGYITGTHSLSAEVIEAAGFDYIARELGYDYGGTLPLEALIFAAPDLVITGPRYPGASRSEEILAHPALAEMQARRVQVEDRNWICGLPAALDTVAQLGAVRQGMAQ